MLVQANQRVFLSKWWVPEWASLDTSGVWGGLHRTGGNSSSFTTEYGGWPVQLQKCSLQIAVSIDISKVLVPSLSFGKGMAFCLLAPGPQGFISSFQP